MARLELYAAMLVEAQTRMNLVGPATLPELWNRHVRDSAQLAALAPAGLDWLDIGAGAGFPGLVLAILGGAPVTLVESTAKKCAFLQAVIDATLAPARVVNARVESLAPVRPHVITARACAPLARLLGWGLPHARPDTRWLCLKGARAADELAEARKAFAFDAELVHSLTDPAAAIVVLTGVRAR